MNISSSTPAPDPAELTALRARVAELECALATARADYAHAQALLASINDAIIVLDAAGLIRHWNPAAERIYGWLAADVYGQPLDDLLHTRYLGTARKIAQATLAAFDAWTGTLLQRHRDGYDVVIEASLSVLRDARGEVAALMGSYRDISHRHDLETTVLAQETRYRTLVEHLPLVIFQANLVDVNSSAYVSPQIEELLGYTPAEWCRDPQFWLSRIHPEDIERMLAQQARFQETGIPEASEHRMIARDGRVVWVRDELVIVRNDPSRPPYLLGITRDITARKQAELDLRIRDRALAAIDTGIVIVDATQPDMPIIDANPAFVRITGYTVMDVIGRNCRLLQGPDTDPATRAEIRAALAARRTCQVVIKNYRKNGTPFWNEMAITPVWDTEERLTHFVGLLTDVTERLRFEAEVRQAQKMESVGRLAGGVAHDFNNLLTVISGAAELARDDLPADHPVQTDLRDITSAAARAAALTRQLLAFARKQMLAPRVIDLNALVEDTQYLLQRLLQKHIQLITRLAPDLRTVKVDPNQIQQVLINLAVNARDAMPAGGTLRIETANAVIDAVLADRYRSIIAGPHVRITVADTGVGIAPEVQARLFEPFFTTKAPGQGTGLGLATCYGIIKQHGGSIWVESAVGRGTTVIVYLPVVDDATEPILIPTDDTIPRGTETILVAEDETSVRIFAARVLRDLGYTVLEAGNGTEARRIAQEGPPIQLLLTDVVIPELDGLALAAQLAARWADLKVLYMSGYTEHAGLGPDLVPGISFLQKPFTRATLAHMVRAALNALR